MFTPTCNYVYISRCMSNSKYQFCHCKSIRSFACSKRISPNQKFLALQIWRHLLELHFEKQKFTFTLQVWLHVVPLQSKWHVSAYIALRYSSSYMRKLPRTIFKVFKAKCLLSSLPGRCNRFARELSRPKKIMPWLRETISKVIFLGRIYQNVFNKRIRPTKNNPRNSRSSNRSERV